MIYQDIKAQVIQDYIAPSDAPDMLPSERELSERYSVSRPTIRKALMTLSDEGKLDKASGRGYLRRSTKPKYTDHELNTFIGFFEDVNEQGKNTHSKVIQQTVQPASAEVAEHLAIDEGDMIFVLERIRFVDDTPVCIAKSCLPLALVPDIADHDFTSESLFSVLENQGLQLAVADRSIEVVRQSTRDNLYLSLEPDEPIMKFNSIGYTKEQTPFEYETSKYPAFTVKFATTVKKQANNDEGTTSTNLKLTQPKD